MKKGNDEIEMGTLGSRIQRSDSTRDLMVKKGGNGNIWHFFLTFLIGGLLGVGVTVLVNEVIKEEDNESTICTEITVSTSQATSDDLVNMGMKQENADTLIKFRESVGGIILDPMDLLDHDVDVDTVLAGAEVWSNNSTRRRRRLEGEASSSSSSMADVVKDLTSSAESSGTELAGSLDGVDPSSEAFERLAESVVENNGEGGCELDQMCLNEADARTLKTLKYVGAVTSQDFVKQREDNGLCITSLDDLMNENGEMDSYDLKSSTKTAFKRALNYLRGENRENELCASCGCALCSDGEIWNSTRCVSRCDDGFIWKNEECIDANTSPEVIPPAPTPSPVQENHTSIVRFDESPKQIRFSPVPKQAARGVWHGIQDILKSSKSSIDVAMFSFSDVTHRKQLIAAAERGVQVRVVMETSSCSASACKYCKELIEATEKLENPIKVRYVTPTMHNKFTVVDYDSMNDNPNRRECVVATGSCNWSVSSAIRYDEDWMKFEGDLAPKTIRAYKQEFEWLWAHSRPCRDDPDDVSEVATQQGWLEPRVEFDGCFTSYNMEPTLSSDNVWGFRYLNDDTTGACNSKMVEAIENAQESIDIAHTYFRSEVVYDAVMRRVQDGIHVRVINDGKEFRNSNNLPIELSEEGADVRFKYYARGWDFGCAQQMHMKFFLIDANLALEGKCVVITGSENLSDGSEKRTFENVIFSRSPWVCEEYKNQFAKLRSYGVQSNENRTSAVQRYNDEATCFFSPITLSGQEIKDLRNSIDCRLRVGEYDGNFPEGECTFWGDHRPVLCFQSWYSEPCPSVEYVTTALGEYPDLEITNYTIPVDTFNVGSSLEGTSCTVTNKGVAQSQSVKMQFVAARTMDKDDPTASQISWSTIPSLAPGDSFTATPRFNFGSGHDLGPFQIWCYVDSDELLLELSKDNNRVGIELQLQDRDLNRNASDLVFHTAAIVQSEPYGELVAGNTIDFYGIVKNVGNRHTRNTTELTSSGVPEQIMMNLYISTDENWDSGPVREGGDEQIGWVRIDPLDVGESMAEIDKTVRINTIGTFYIIVVIDNTRAVHEQIELNNVWVSSVPIVVSSASDDDDDSSDPSEPQGPSPDLVVVNFRFDENGPTIVNYGDQITVLTSVKNVGDLPMSNVSESEGGSCKDGVGIDCTRLKYYFYQGAGIDVITEGKTADEVKTEYGMKYWYYEKINALVVNETQEHTQSKTISSTYLDIGCWSVFALLDYDDFYEELDEQNNFPFVDFEVNADTGVGPDLTGTLSWSVPSRVPQNSWPDGTAPLGARVNLNISMTIDDLSQVDDDTSFEVRIYLSQQSVSSRCVGGGSSSQEVFITNRMVTKNDFVPNNGSFDLLLEARMPVNVEEASYRILAKLDNEGMLAESVESNNIAVAEITIDNVLNAQNERAGMPSEMQTDDEYCTSIIKLDAKLYEKPSIGFWNLLHLSAKTQTEQNRREWGIISCIAAHFDVLAVVELEDLNALKYLAKRACDVTTQTDCECTKTSENAPSTCDWDWHISPHEAGRNGVCEYVGFVWNKNNAQFVSPMGYYNEGVNDTMKREPYGARFQMGNFDFTMAGVHQRHGGHVKYRQAEAVYSGDVFTQYQDADCGSERDVFYGGDMNLDASDTHWSLVYDQEYASLDAKWGVDPEQGTTLARTGDRTITDNAFDQIFWSGISSAAIDESGAFDFTSPEIASIHAGETMGSNIYTTVSDHIPVYVILSDSIYESSFVDADSDVTCSSWVPWPAANSTDDAAVRNRDVDCPA